MKFLYLDKKDRIRAWFTPQNTAIAAVILGLLLATPVWKESVAGKFVLEPVDRAVVRAHVPGRVSEVYVREGETVAKGGPLATLHNIPLESNLENAETRLVLASAEAREAALRYQGYGNALAEKRESARQYTQLSEMNVALELKAPIGGIVVTPKVQDQLGAYLKAGTELLEIADLSRMRARIYTSEYELYKIHTGETARLQLDGMLRRRDGQVTLVSARPTEKPLWAAQEAGRDSDPEGARQYYFVDILLENPEGDLKPGMGGVARVYSNRRSLGGLALEVVKNSWGRKLW
jgi:multidrug resistance efflux pump